MSRLVCMDLRPGRLVAIQGVRHRIQEIQSGGPMLTGLEPPAFFWFFGGLIEERFEEAIKDLPWPENVMPVAERRERIKEIDAEIGKLTSRRTTLQAQLKSAMWG